MTAPLVIGTAGHIDHGKTSLVRALSGGAALDRLPEEAERGITITLGFATLQVGERFVYFVDVPGHERLVRTMVSGATGIDAAMLVVSAVEGVMPQTREHLAILDLLGIKAGILVLTMVDLVDAEMVELAGSELRDLVQGTFLADAPLCPVSSVSGAGLDALKAAIAALPAVHRPVDGPFRLPVDRTFVRAGFGTVVTGTAWSGRVADGALVRLLPEGGNARVRGIESHGDASDVAEAGRRIALNLSGVEHEDAGRGTVVVTGDVPCTSMIDVRYVHLAGAPELPDGAEVRVLHGTAERTGRLYLAEDADDVMEGVHFAQVRLESPLPCLPGDRYVVRRVSPAETLGGGEIVDPWAPKLKRKERVAHGEQIGALYAGDKQMFLLRAGEVGLTREEAAGRVGAGEPVGTRVFHPAVAERLDGLLGKMLADFHAANPLARGAGRRELRRERLAHLDEAVFDGLVERGVAAGKLAVDGPLVRDARFSVKLDPRQERLRAAVWSAAVNAGVEGVRLDELVKALGDGEAAAVLKLVADDGKLENVPGIGWITREALEKVESDVRGWFAANAEMTAGQFKELTGTSRKTAIPLLEWLDRKRITRRAGDVRMSGAPK